MVAPYKRKIAELDDTLIVVGLFPGHLGETFLIFLQSMDPSVHPTRLPLPGRQEIQWLIFEVSKKSFPISLHSVKSITLKSTFPLGGVEDTGTSANCLFGNAGHGVTALLPLPKLLKSVNVYAHTRVHPPPSVRMSQ